MQGSYQWLQNLILLLVMYFRRGRVEIVHNMAFTKFICQNSPPSEEFHIPCISTHDVVFDGCRIVTFLSLGAH
jgi:hypothetical protein